MQFENEWLTSSTTIQTFMSKSATFKSPAFCQLLGCSDHGVLAADVPKLLNHLKVTIWVPSFNGKSPICIDNYVRVTPWVPHLHVQNGKIHPNVPTGAPYLFQYYVPIRLIRRNSPGLDSQGVCELCRFHCNEKPSFFRRIYIIESQRTVIHFMVSWPLPCWSNRRVDVS